MNEITLQYAGMRIKHTITADEVACFVAERFARPSDEDHVKSQISDGLKVLDYVFGIGKRIGFAELFGKNPEFQAYLLNNMKGASNGKPQNA